MDPLCHMGVTWVWHDLLKYKSQCRIQLQSWKKRFGTLLHTIPIHNIITSVVKGRQISCKKWNVMYNRYDLTSPLPPQSMLGHFGKLMMALVCSTLKRGRGVVFYCCLHETVPSLFSRIVCAECKKNHLISVFRA